MTREQHVELQSLAVLHSELQYVMLIGSILMMGVGALDFVVFPSHFRTFLLLRSFSSAYLLICWSLLRYWRGSFSERFVTFNVLSATASVAIVIGIMISQTGGYSSMYYVGLFLILFVSTTLISMHPLLTLCAGLISYSCYLAPSLIVGGIADVRLFINNNFFMLSFTGSAVLLSALRRRDVVAKFTLEYSLSEEIERQKRLEQELRSYTEELAQSETRYRMLIELAPEGIALITDKGIEFMNPAGLDLLGVADVSDLSGKGIEDLCIEDDRLLIQRKMAAAAESGMIDWFETRVGRMNGTACDVEIAGVRIEYHGGRALQLLFRDITERKVAEKRLKLLAERDSLTGLQNRHAFTATLRERTIAAGERDGIMALLFIDLDDFKRVNDTMGHEAGDVVLKGAAKRITHCLRDSDVVARIGGDEFVALLSRIHAKQDTLKVLERIVTSLTQPFSIDGKTCVIGTSIGVSFFPQDSRDPEELLKQADSAMYSIKRCGKNGYRFYEDIEGEHGVA